MGFKSIAFIGPAHPLRGGISDFNERLAQELQNEGYDITLYSYKLQYPKILFPGKTQFREGEAPKDLKIDSCINSISPINWRKVGNKIAKTKPDLVIVKFWLPFMGPALGTILKKIRKKSDAKIIALVDNMIPHENRPGDKMFTRYFVKQVDAWIAMSDQVLNDIKSFDDVKPKAMYPHPLYDNFGESVTKSTAKEKLNLEANDKYLLFFGLVRDYKGLDLLLRALGQADFKVFAKESKIKLLIAGEYYDKEEKYLKIIEKHGIENMVISKNCFIPHEEVKYYFCAADLVCQPYKTATQSGISQIAYHFNKPMLVTNVGGLPEIVPHEKVGFVCEKKPEDIARNIMRYFNENREEQFSKAMLEEKKRFSWSGLSDVIKEVHSKI
jgi:glycosyltransferase involved in cell wall biosynthesis